MNVAGTPRIRSGTALRPSFTDGKSSVRSNNRDVDDVAATAALDLSFYAEPPNYELSLDEFEEFALARLKVLRTIEELRTRNVTGIEFRKQLQKAIEENLKPSLTSSSSSSSSSTRSVIVSALSSKTNHNHNNNNHNHNHNHNNNMRIAAVTGSNKGIGYHIALQLAQSGKFTNVILACRDEARGKAALKEIQTHLLVNDSTNSSNNNNNNNNSNNSNNISMNCKVSYEPLTLGDKTSHDIFYNIINEKYYGKLDVLVNNAAMAYKGNDPTPFKKQCKPTLDINFFGTLHFTDRMMPLIRKGTDARIVNVASMAGRLDQITSKELKERLSHVHLTKDELIQLVDTFTNDVLTGTHQQNGWGNSNYGMSKLAVIAMTKVWARMEVKNGIKVNCCCPGYCDTDMTSHKGPRSPSDGAKNAVIPAATMDESELPTGQYFANNVVSEW